MKMRGEPVPVWQYLFIVAWFFVCSLVGIPMEWIIAGAAIGGGIAYAGFPNRLVKLPMRVVGGTAFIGLGFAYAWVGMKQTNTIVLKDSEVSFTDVRGVKSVPREGLQVHRIHQEQGANIHAWSSWSTYSRPQGKDELGPHIAGFDVYWGPHGLVRGDDLALHMARWAGVVPTVH
jgi:hypothetical protein